MQHEWGAATAADSDDEGPPESAMEMQALDAWSRRETRLSLGMAAAKAIVAETTCEIVSAPQEWSACRGRAATMHDAEESSGDEEGAKVRFRLESRASEAWSARERRLSVASMAMKAMVASTEIEIIETADPEWEAEVDDGKADETDISGKAGEGPHESESSIKTFAEEAWKRREHRLTIATTVPQTSFVEVCESKEWSEDDDKSSQFEATEAETAALDAWQQRETRLSTGAASLRAMVTEFAVEVLPQNTDPEAAAVAGEESDEDVEAVQRGAWEAREKRLSCGAVALKAVVLPLEVEVVQQNNWAADVDSDEDTDAQAGIQNCAQSSWTARERRLTAASIVSQNAEKLAAQLAMPGPKEVDVKSAEKDLVEDLDSEEEPHASAAKRERTNSAMWYRREKRLSLATQALQTACDTAVEVKPAQGEWKAAESVVDAEDEAYVPPVKHALEVWKKREQRLEVGRKSLKARVAPELTEVVSAPADWAQAPASSDEEEKEVVQLATWRSREKRLSTASQVVASERRRSSLSNVQSVDIHVVQIVESATDWTALESSSSEDEVGNATKTPTSARARQAQRSLQSWAKREKRLSVGAGTLAAAGSGPCDKDIQQLRPSPGCPARYAEAPPQRCDQRCSDQCSIQ